ncbi:enoyl-CoA hydratase/isomerase family protein [Seohaeicola nanhaiensis]|uniref:Enoyl-CoA hydratase/isomerase family protein n=1 Tax=Seohaeicola nanhaiensis TaxID=1387282 RepID=A0ABV9KL62_9RHOB
MEQLTATAHDSLLHLELNVPGKKNALTDILRRELREAIVAAQTDPSVRAIVLSGAGGSFCSGGDISAMTSDREVARARMTILHDVVRMLLAGTRPVVAAVAGPAYGAGMSLALCCDQVIVDPSARFSASFGRVGLPPDLALGFTLPRRVGEGRARRMLLSGSITGAEEAVRIGLADEISAEGQLIETAITRARELAAFTQEAKGHVKAMLTENAGSLDAVLSREMASYLTLLQSAEHRAARDAFLKKSG